MSSKRIKLLRKEIEVKDLVIDQLIHLIAENNIEMNFSLKAIIQKLYMDKINGQKEKN